MLSQYDSLINKAAVMYNVPIAWIKTIIQTESSGNPKAYRAEPKLGTGSYGLGQFLPSTAKSLGYPGSNEGLYDPATNINLIGKYLGQLRIQYGDDLKRVYSAYNSGKPDLYLSSSQVANNVQNALNNLTMVLKDEPLILTMGLVGGLVVVAIVWYWSKGR